MQLSFSFRLLSNVTYTYLSNDEIIFQYTNLNTYDHHQYDYEVLNENNFPKQLANNIISRITTNLINEINKQNNILYERLHQEIEQLKDSDKKQNDIFGFPIL